MTKLIFPAILLTFTVYSFMPPAFAQDNETAAPPVTGADETAPEEPEVRASQEVEINEDNYRQFMELKDANLERGVIPENVFKPGTGLQKLDKLPEASQKHLRNELREIIVQGDPWQPGDADKEFAYVPSEAAGKDPALQNQEMEAWGELVDSYHQREAQIYENSAGSRAARGSENGSRNNPGAGAGANNGASQSDADKPGQQTGQENMAEQSDGAGTYSPDSSSSTNATSTEGVSQNAMEFLQSSGKGGSISATGNEGSAAEDGESGEAQQTAKNDHQDDGRENGQYNGQDGGQLSGQVHNGQQTETAQKMESSVDTVNNSQASSAQTEQESTEGASQNALEYLTRERTQTADSLNNEPETDQPEGTLTIQELINARGIGGSNGTNPPATKTENVPSPENEPDKDGGG